MSVMQQLTANSMKKHLGGKITSNEFVTSPMSDSGSVSPVSPLEDASRFKSKIADRPVPRLNLDLNKKRKRKNSVSKRDMEEEESDEEFDSSPLNSPTRASRVGAWTAEEDEKLKTLIGQHGPKKWSLIAQHLPGRVGKQARERWFNHLDPSINKNWWTPEEEELIITFHEFHGNQWSLISKLLNNGRPANAIKNHWNSTLKKAVEKAKNAMTKDSTFYEVRVARQSSYAKRGLGSPEDDYFVIKVDLTKSFEIKPLLDKIDRSFNSESHTSDSQEASSSITTRNSGKKRRLVLQEDSDVEDEDEEEEQFSSRSAGRTEEDEPEEQEEQETMDLEEEETAEEEEEKVEECVEEHPCKKRRETVISSVGSPIEDSSPVMAQPYNTFSNVTLQQQQSQPQPLVRNVNYQVHPSQQVLPQQQIAFQSQYAEHQPHYQHVQTAALRSVFGRTLSEAELQKMRQMCLESICFNDDEGIQFWTKCQSIGDSYLYHNSDDIFSFLL